MKRFLLLTIVLFSATLYSNAQITWEKLFVKPSTDVFRCVQEVPAGGYIAAGYTANWSSNDSDAYLVRLTVTGDTLWTRSFNGGKVDILYKVINTADGGFVTCGYTDSYSINGDQDAWYAKFDANGNMLWSFTYGGIARERGQDIIQTSDGGYAMCGYTNSGLSSFNSFLLKIDANGGQTWNMKYGGVGFDDANSLKELPNGDFIMVGQSTSAGGLGQGDIWLVRTNSVGAQQWTQNIGTALNDNAEYIQLVPGGGFIICGSTEGAGVGGGDGYLVKTDDLGVVQWDQTFGGSWSDDFHRVENTSDGGFIVVGTTQSNAAVISNQWLVKTNSTGDSSWVYTFGGANHDHAYSVVQTLDGGYVFCGYTASFGFNYEDALVIKVDSNGLLYNHLFYATVEALVMPVNNSCGSANSVVKIAIRNFGDTTLSVFPDSVYITGAITAVLGQTFTGGIAPFDTAHHTFTTTINTSGGGVFNFHCFTSTNNDVYPAMNSRDSVITINALPGAPSVTGDTTCGPGQVTLTATSPNTIDWYSSATGGTLLQANSSTYSPTISNTTTYYVQATNACGSSTRTAVTAYVFSTTNVPTVFSAQRCGPGPVTLLATSGSPISWWDAPTGGNQLQGNISTYLVNVTSTTTFYVEAGTGSPCPSARVPVTATVNPLPDAAFTPNAPAVCLGDAFQFTNNTTGAVGYTWNFGDGTGTSSQSNPTYTYAQTGSYNVRLIAVSAQSCYDTIIVAVSVNTAPQISFTASDAIGCIPFTVNFSNATTNATNYIWNFGDGNSSTDANPSHVYNTAGTFTVSLVATVGSCADSDSVVGMITVHTPVPFDLGPDITTNSVTYVLDAGAGFASYTWNTGASTQMITADTNGIYCVTVTDNNNCNSNDCIQVSLDVLGADQLSSDKYFMIYPNPAGDAFSILTSSPITGAVKIYDSIGNLVYLDHMSEAVLKVNTANWPAGVYFVEVHTGHSQAREKLFIY